MNHIVRLGIIGLGNIAKQHIQDIKNGLIPHCELSAICSRSTNTYTDTLSVKHFTDYKILIDSGSCDAVIIATPTFSHAKIGLYALSAGLHVLMEKPIGLSILEGENLLNAASDSSVFALMLNQRADPLFIKMKSLIDSGRLGKLTRYQWTMTNWFRPEIYFQISDWRATWKGEGGGLLVNQCIHNLDIFQWLCGMPKALRAHCYLGKHHNIEVEDEVNCLLEFANGASGTFVGSTGEAPGVNQLDIVGDKGRLSFDGKHLFLFENDQGTTHYSKHTSDMFGCPNTLKYDITPSRDINQHAVLIDNFCQAIIHKAKLIAPAKEGIHSLSLANAMLLSNWKDKKIHFPLDANTYQEELNIHIKNSKPRQITQREATIDMSKSYR